MALKVPQGLVKGSKRSHKQEDLERSGLANTEMLTKKLTLDRKHDESCGKEEVDGNEG